MPTSDAPAANLAPQLASALLQSLAWVAGAAVLVSLLTLALSARDAPVVSRLQRRAFGTLGAQPEPGARRFVRIAFGLLWIVDGLLQAQPRMPTGFVTGNLNAVTSTAPGWFADLVAPFGRAWARHPVSADAVTVWVQIGLGMLLLVGGCGLLARTTAWAVIAWSLVVWVLGEGFGGLLSDGATWWTGSPGAVLIYAFAAALLLAPREWWTCGRAALVARRFTAGWLAVGALLQVIPFEKAWSANGASGPFRDGAANAQPQLLARPIAEIADVAAHHPVLVNETTIVLLIGVAAGLWFTTSSLAVQATLVLCAATWWLAQDFGVLGGTGTDPNTALPLGILAASTLPAWSAARARPAVTPSTTPTPTPSTTPSTVRMRLRLSVGAGAVTLGVTAALLVPAAFAAVLPTPPDAAAVAADSGGGLRAIPPRPSPDFDLVDQNGTHVSLSGLRGKLVVLTFLDAVCSTDCPLIANQLAIADRRLGVRSAQVEFVALDTNPVFRYRQDVASFTRSHGLDGLPNWHFVFGDPDVVQQVLASYGISVVVPSVGMIEHDEAIYFIRPDGKQVAYLADGAAAPLTRTYADQVYDETRSLLR